MATFLDVSGLEHFASFFVFLFVWLVVYSLLQYTKVLGENQGVNIIVGLLIGLFVLFSPLATGIVQNIAPWFAVLFIFAIFAVAGMRVMGATDADIAGAGQLKLLLGILAVIVIFVGALSYIRGEVSVPGDNETSVDYSRPSAVIFHPNILGVIFIGLVATFTIALLASRRT
ncbi:MAG: hypothetical protein ABIJ08_03140 [Nanoarchaeota archaeon]